MELKDILTISLAAIGSLIALVSLIRALVEYQKQGATKRSEIFLDMRSRLREDESFSRICDLLERDDPKLREIPLVDRDRFIGFFEELALLRNSGLINDEVTLYMFGYFAIRCIDSRNFWYDLNRDQPLWAAFMDFARDMKSMHTVYEYDSSRFHL